MLNRCHIIRYVLLSSSNLERQSVDLAHGDESGAAATESERVSLDGPVGDELAGAHVGELGEVHDAAPPVLANPAVAATLGWEQEFVIDIRVKLYTTYKST